MGCHARGKSDTGTVDVWLGRALFLHSPGNIEEGNCQRRVKHSEYRRQDLSRQYAVKRIFERMQKILVRRWRVITSHQPLPLSLERIPTDG